MDAGERQKKAMVLRNRKHRMCVSVIRDTYKNNETFSRPLPKLGLLFSVVSGFPRVPRNSLSVSSQPTQFSTAQYLAVLIQVHQRFTKISF